MVDSYLHKADTQEEDVIKRRRNQHRINWAKFITIYIRYINTRNTELLLENQHFPDTCFLRFLPPANEVVGR